MEKKEDQKLAGEVVKKYVIRSLSATNVEILQTTEDKENWLFKLSYLAKDDKIRTIIVEFNRKSRTIGNVKDI